MKPFGDMTLEEKVDWGLGAICMALGRGKVREAVCDIIITTNHEAYERGFRAGSGKKNRRKQ